MPPRRRGSGHLAQDSHRPASRKKLAGVILRLPQRNGLRSHSGIPDGCYDHPVVVLSPRAASVTDNVTILILTSFGETDIVDKIPSPKPRRPYLPIYPSPHPDTNVQLFLKNGVILRKNSYINTREKHTIPLDILIAYDRRDPNTRYVLESESYQQLTNHADFVPDLYTMPTSDPGASTRNTTPPIPLSPETHLPIRSQSERPKYPPGSIPQTPLLNHWEVQYGTVPGARAPLLVGGIHNHSHYTTPRSSSHHTAPPAPVRYGAQNSRADTLPRYNDNPRVHGYNGTSSGGSSSYRGGRAWWALFAALVVALALWWVCTSLGALGQGLFSGLRWAAVNTWQLVKGAVAGW